MMRLPWQTELLRELGLRAAAGRLPHALLVSGEPGVGKRQLSMRLAAMLQCMAQAPEQRPCEACRGCRLNAAGTHPDRWRLEPAEPGKAIRVDEVREMIEFLARTPQIARSKVVVVHPADAMNHHAANSLLKSLEEPPGSSFILLVTSRPGHLPATVRSRCQSVKAPLPSPEQALPWLREQIGEVAEDALRSAGGRPLAALASVLQGGESDGARRFLADLRRFVEGGLPLHRMLAGRHQEDLTLLVQQLNELLVDLLRWQATRDPARLRHPDAAELFEALGRRASPARLHRLFEDQLAISRMLASAANPNPQLLLEDLLLRWRQACLGRPAIDPRGLQGLSFSG